MKDEKGLRRNQKVELIRKEFDKPKAPPLALEDMSPEDEKRLVDAIKQGEEDGWPMKRVFEELSKVRIHMLQYSPKW